MRDPLVDWSTCSGVEIDSQRQSGAPVFAGTRIPVNVVLNNIHHGGTPGEINNILDNFPVTREQINLVLDHLQGKFTPLLRRQPR